MAPVAPVLYLLGPEREAKLVLRLLATLCRRSVSLADVDITALLSLPEGLNVTFLINQRELSKNVRKFLMASGDRYFHAARGNNNLHTCGARAISTRAELTSGSGVRVVLSPTTARLPLLSDARQQSLFLDFQSKLLRYRELYWRQVRDAKPEFESSVGPTDEELCAWLAPLLDSADLRKPVMEYFLQSARSVAADDMTNELCLAAEAALFFCCRENTDHFFVAELAETINNLLQGRHELRSVTDKKAGMLLRELGIPSRRTAKGFKVSLTQAVREQIQAVARAYLAASVVDGVMRCRYSPAQSV